MADAEHIDMLISWVAPGNPDFYTPPRYYGILIKDEFGVIQVKQNNWNSTSFPVTLMRNVIYHIEVWALSDFHNASKICSKDIITPQ